MPFASECERLTQPGSRSKEPSVSRYATISRMITTASSPSDPIREIVWVLTRKMFPCWSLLLVRVLRRWLLAQIAEVCLLRVMVRSGVPAPQDPYRDLGPRQLDAGPVTSYSTGGYHSGNYALWTRPDGSLWAVGISFYGRFGNGNANQYTFNDPQQLLSTGVSAVAAGPYHSDR